MAEESGLKRMYYMYRERPDSDMENSLKNNGSNSTI